MTGRLDPRAWLIWWIAASLPALVGRNPVPLLTVFLVILLVRTVVQPASAIVSPSILKLFVVLSVISVVFNALTVHAGDIVLFTVPDGVPLLGGEITLNAVLYGVLGSLGILTLVMAGLTVAEQIEWTQIMRMLPDSLLGFGVAGSIAFTFFPQMVASFREIREARLIRGAPLNSLSDYVSIVTPMLTTGLDRAVSLSELLEVRAFGGASPNTHGKSRASLFPPVAVMVLVIGAYLVLTSDNPLSLLAFGTGTALLGGWMLRSRARSSSRTRYREVAWTSRDSVVVVASSIAIVAIFWTLATNPAAVRYEPYPELDWPVVSVPLTIALCGLAAPGAVVLYGDSGHD